MRYLITLSLLFLISCKGDDPIASGVVASCSPTVTEAKFWTAVGSGTAYDLRGTESGVAYFMVFVDDGVCDPNDNEYMFRYTSSTLTIEFADCSGNIVSTADYEINCQNELRIYNYSDGTADQLLR